MTTGSRLAD